MFVRAWGEGLFSDGKVLGIPPEQRTPGGPGYTAVYGAGGCHACGAHAIRVDPDGHVWVVDRKSHTMSRGMRTWVELVLGWLIVLGLLNTIADFLGIAFSSALALFVGAIGIVVFLQSNWLQQRKPCEHGVWAGSSGRCRACQKKEAYLKEKRDAAWKKQERQKTVEQEANRLRDREVERLSKACLSNAKTYFEMGPREFENAVAELFRALGYDVKQTPFSNDGGKDAVARKDGKLTALSRERVPTVIP